MVRRWKFTAQAHEHPTQPTLLCNVEADAGNHLATLLLPFAVFIIWRAEDPVEQLCWMPVPARCNRRPGWCQDYRATGLLPADMPSSYAFCRCVEDAVRSGACGRVAAAGQRWRLLWGYLWSASPHLGAPSRSFVPHLGELPARCPDFSLRAAPDLPRYQLQVRR